MVFATYFKHSILATASAVCCTSCTHLSVEENEAYVYSESLSASGNQAGSKPISTTAATYQIDCQAPVSMVLRQGSEVGYELKGDERRIARLEVKQVDNKFIIKEKSGWFGRIDGGKCEVIITVPDLSSLEISGAGALRTDGIFVQQSAMDIEVSGAASVKLELDAPALRVDASGASSILLSGRVHDLMVDMSGAGKISALDMQAQTAAIESSGAGSVAVWAEQRLSIDASGVGSVRYKGNPELIKDVSGMVSIKRVP